MFTKKFDDYVIIGDSISCVVGQYTVKARVELNLGTNPIEFGERGENTHYMNVDDPEHGEENARIIDAWHRDEWFYGELVLEVIHTESSVVLDSHAASMCELEFNFPDSDNSYVTGIANELLDDAVSAGKKVHGVLQKKLVDTP